MSRCWRASASTRRTADTKRIVVSRLLNRQPEKRKVSSASCGADGKQTGVAEEQSRNRQAIWLSLRVRTRCLAGPDAGEGAGRRPPTLWRRCRPSQPESWQASVGLVETPAPFTFNHPSRTNRLASSTWVDQRNWPTGRSSFSSNPASTSSAASRAQLDGLQLI